MITPLQLLHHQISQPSSSRPSKPPEIAEIKPITLTRADVDGILRRTRSATPAELEYAIANAKELKLSDYDRNRLGVDLSVIVAMRTRQLRRADPAAEFIHKVLDLAETPYGLVEMHWVREQMKAGSEAISRCRNHRPPECQCWSASRSILWQAMAGDKTPTGYASTQIYSFLEDLETSSRPEKPVIAALETVPESDYLAARRNPYQRDREAQDT